MKEPVLMKMICYDSVLVTDQLAYTFFKDDDDEPGDRFNTRVETDIVKWIFNHPYNLTEYLFFQELQIEKSCLPYFEIKRPIIKDTLGPGDIDILLLNKLKPQYSTGFQVKKIKAIINENDVAVLKTSQINKGIQQAKWMHEKFRFHKNYLMLVIVTDTQRRNHNSQMFRHNTIQEKAVVYEHSGFGDLPEEVGIFVMEINQPSTNSINCSKQYLIGQLITKEIN